MEKKKTKLTISGTSKKTIDNIEIAKSKAKNSVIIEKRQGKFCSKQSFQKPYNQRPYLKPKKIPIKNEPIIAKPTSDYEKRKLAEQRATKRLKGEAPQKGKSGFKKRELKLTISRALSDEDNIGGTRSRSLASLKRAKLKENRDRNDDLKDSLKPVKRDVKIPEVITIRELANRMAEQSSNLIKHLLSMGVTATINHNINSDIA